MQRATISKRSTLWMLGMCLLITGTSGCADFWDEVTSHDFKMKQLWEKSPPPLEVLSKSTDGAKRGQALASLREPKQHGGTDQQQDDYLRILTAAVTKDPEALCRLGAIQALADYKDPRAHQLLREVYMMQHFTEPKKLNSHIHIQALTALEKSGSPVARELFMSIAASPGPFPKATLKDQQETNDERTAAIRGLAHFPDVEVGLVLVKVLDDEKDVLLRDRARASLIAITGKTLPDDAGQWRAYLQSHPNDVAHKDTNPLKRFFGN